MVEGAPADEPPETEPDRVAAEGEGAEVERPAEEEAEEAPVEAAEEERPAVEPAGTVMAACCFHKVMMSWRRGVVAAMWAASVLA